MRKFAKPAEAIAATTKKLQKTSIVADYLRSLKLRSSRFGSLPFRKTISRVEWAARCCGAWVENFPERAKPI